MAKKISAAGLAIIKKYEGLKLTAYKCPAGVWTIGYGHTSGVKQGMKITESEATKFLVADVANAEKAVQKYDSIYNWNQNQFDALVSFTFNCGSGNLQTLLGKGKRTIAEISAKIPAYNKGGDEVLAGLVKRRAEEKALFDKAAEDKPAASAVTITVKEWQKAAIADGYKFPKYGADGAWGSECESVAKKAIVKKRLAYTNKNLTKLVQKVVGVEADGLCGKGTAAAIKVWQKANGLIADGCVGVNSWKKMLGVEE